MNANELKVLEDSLKVIEQLQAEKEALEQRVDEVKDTNGTLVDLVQLQREEIDKLRQQQAEIDTYKSQNNNQIDTYKYKNLTDAEITEVITKIANNNEYVYSLYEDFEGIEFSRVGIYELCKAILRKAQEK